MRMRAIGSVAGIITVLGIQYYSQPVLAGDPAVCPALHEAAFLDEPEEVRALLAAGADVNCLDVLGHTPLVTAVNGASMASFEILLSAGARVNVRTEFGQTLLAHTKTKYASFNETSGAKFRKLYNSMIVRLENAGAVN